MSTFSSMHILNNKLRVNTKLSESKTREAPVLEIDTEDQMDHIIITLIGSHEDTVRFANELRNAANDIETMSEGIEFAKMAKEKEQLLDA